VQQFALGLRENRLEQRLVLRLGIGIVGELSRQFEIDNNLDVRLRELMTGSLGDSSGAPGHFARMVYLSAVTITTLGFGDLIPTTDWGRFAIGLEAVLGVFIAGMFINAVASRGR
jgi:hypothetical protein